MTRPLTSVTIEVPLIKKTEFSTDTDETTADGDHINANEITHEAGTYELRLKFEDPAKQFDATVSALKESRRDFRDMLPDHIKEDYTVMIHDMDISVDASYYAMVAAANLRRHERSTVNSLFHAVERINRLPGFLDVSANFISWFYDYGPDDLASMTREECIDWLDSQLDE